MKCFYHTDSDGFCSAYWVLRYCQKMDIANIPSDFMKINYGWKFPFDTISENELVFIVDFSIEPSDMTKLLKITQNVVWIDHHITAITKYKDYNVHIAGIRTDQKIAGCMLTYIFMKGLTYNNSWSPTFKKMLENNDIFKCENNGFPEIFIDSSIIENYLEITTDYINMAPKFTRLISDHDVWEYKYGDDTKYFQLALRSESLAQDPSNSFWHNLENFPMKTEDMINVGECMDIYKTSFDSSYVKRLGFDAHIEHNGKKYKCKVVNIALCNMSLFDSITDKSDYDIFVIFSFDGKRGMYRYTLYSSKIDVSKIAFSFGGGGHKGGAGFSLNENIFETHI